MAWPLAHDDCRALLEDSFPEEALYAQAREVAGSHHGSMQASPLILTGNCTTRPICRHCKWEHFKAVSKNEFVLDKSADEVVERAHLLVRMGIGRAFCATGWMGYRLPDRFVASVAAIREAEPDLELYGLFGALDRESHHMLAQVGLTGMLTGLESPNEEIYRMFRPGGDSLADRLHALEFAKEEGLAVWTGFLVGLGEDEDDVIDGISLMRRFDPESVSILPFVPFPDTPMAGNPRVDPSWLARINAVARIALPDVHYFFSDHADGFDETTERALGMNGSYETGIGKTKAPTPSQ